MGTVACRKPDKYSRLCSVASKENSLSRAWVYAFVRMASDTGPINSGAMRSTADSSPFTFESRLRVYDSAANSNGKVLYLACGTPREYCYFIIGTNSVRWVSNDRAEHIIHEGDNSDKMNLLTPIPLAQWFHVDMVLTLGQPSIVFSGVCPR